MHDWFIKFLITEPIQIYFAFHKIASLRFPPTILYLIHLSLSDGQFNDATTKLVPVMQPANNASHFHLTFFIKFALRAS
jgi:hypothetical protein